MSVENNIKLFKALSEESRYRIIEILLRGERCACEIPKLIGRTQSNTSMQLNKLIDLGILQARRKGKMRIYAIKDFRVCEIFKSLGYPKKTFPNRAAVQKKTKNNG
ncbi:MAG: metalloregulator ArsR/SmtB family transcription factor [Candidatus Woesearchaeota archaeon]